MVKKIWREEKIYIFQFCVLSQKFCVSPTKFASARKSTKIFSSYLMVLLGAPYQDDENKTEKSNLMQIMQNVSKMNICIKIMKCEFSTTECFCYKIDDLRYGGNNNMVRLSMTFRRKEWQNSPLMYCVSTTVTW